MFCQNCGQENPPEASYCIRCGARLAGTVGLAPGVGSSFSYGRRVLKSNFWELLLAVVIYLALIAAVGAIAWGIARFGIRDAFYFNGSFRDASIRMSWEFQLVSYVLNIVYSTPLLFGLLFVFLGAVRGEKVKYSDIFAAFRNYGNVILVSFLYTLVSVVVSFLLVLVGSFVPALGVFLSIAWAIFVIFILCRLAFVPFLLLDRNMKAFEAIGAGWNMSSGHAGKVFVIGLLGVLMFLGVGLVAFIVALIFIWLPFVSLVLGIAIGVVGGVILYMWLAAAYASLYYAVSGLGTPAPPPVPAPPPQPAT